MRQPTWITNRIRDRQDMKEQIPIINKPPSLFSTGAGRDGIVQPSKATGRFDSERHEGEEILSNKTVKDLGGNEATKELVRERLRERGKEYTDSPNGAPMATGMRGYQTGGTVTTDDHMLTAPNGEKYLDPAYASGATNYSQPSQGEEAIPPTTTTDIAKAQAVQPTIQAPNTQTTTTKDVAFSVPKTSTIKAPEVTTPITQTPDVQTTTTKDVGLSVDAKEPIKAPQTTNVTAQPDVQTTTNQDVAFSVPETKAPETTTGTTDTSFQRNEKEMTQSMLDMARGDSEAIRRITNGAFTQLNPALQTNMTLMSMQLASNPNMTEGAKRAAMAGALRDNGIASSQLAGDMAKKAMDLAMTATGQAFDMSRRSSDEAYKRQNDDYDRMLNAGDFEGAQQAYKAMTGNDINLDTLKKNWDRAANSDEYTSKMAQIDQMIADKDFEGAEREWNLLKSNPLFSALMVDRDWDKVKEGASGDDFDTAMASLTREFSADYNVPLDRVKANIIEELEIAYDKTIDEIAEEQGITTDQVIQNEYDRLRNSSATGITEAMNALEDVVGFEDYFDTDLEKTTARKVISAMLAGNSMEKDENGIWQPTDDAVYPWDDPQYAHIFDVGNSTDPDQLKTLFPDASATEIETMVTDNTARVNNRNDYLKAHKDEDNILDYKDWNKAQEEYLNSGSDKDFDDWYDETHVTPPEDEILGSGTDSSGTTVNVIADSTGVFENVSKETGEPMFENADGTWVPQTYDMLLGKSKGDITKIDKDQLNYYVGIGNGDAIKDVQNKANKDITFLSDFDKTSPAYQKILDNTGTIQNNQWGGMADGITTMKFGDEIVSVKTTHTGSGHGFKTFTVTYPDGKVVIMTKVAEELPIITSFNGNSMNLQGGDIVNILSNSSIDPTPTMSGTKTITSPDGTTDTVDTTTTKTRTGRTGLLD